MRQVAATFGLSLVFASGLAVAQQHMMPSGKMTDDEIIKSAMSAAPEAIGKDATIIDVGSDLAAPLAQLGRNEGKAERGADVIAENKGFGFVLPKIEN